jgi:hypothetical protein
MDNLVHRKWRRGGIWVFRVILSQFRGNFLQPPIQLLCGPGVQRRKGAYNAGFALGYHQIGV